MEEVINYLVRFAHYFVGITWIGLLYYFNFVQTEYFKEAEASARVDAFVKLAPRALWWFRWGAMMTFLTGLYLLYVIGHGATVDIVLSIHDGNPDVPERLAHHLAEPEDHHRVQRAGPGRRRSGPRQRRPPRRRPRWRRGPTRCSRCRCSS